MAIKYIYTLFIGILFAILVGVGIAAFYPAPKYPEYPTELVYPQTSRQETEEERQEFQQKQREFDAKQKSFRKIGEAYNRNVSVITIIIAVAALVVSLTLFRKILLLADGLLLGGVLTLLYSIIRGFGAGDDKFRFTVVAIGFIISLVVGYIKFIKPQKR